MTHIKKPTIKIATLLAGILLGVFAVSGAALAAGTVSGTIKGPHGERAAISYTFTSGSTTVSGTTNGSGVFSQSLADGTWSFQATAPTSVSGFENATDITIPSIKIDSGDSFSLGTIPFYFAAGAHDPEIEDAEGPLPDSLCNITGTPTIIRAYFTDEAKGMFLYSGVSAGVTVVTDAAGDTVTADYSIYENSAPGTNVETATDNGDGTYTIAHTISNSTANTGGLVSIIVTRSGSTTRRCLSGPLNLNIRSFFSGSDTTLFSGVSDFRAISNFTMHQDGIMKVIFRKQVNMLDPTVTKFMRSIAEKMVSATGVVNMDAKAVRELQSAGAEITMYNVPDYGGGPDISLNGQAAGSAVTDVVYDREAKTLTFTAAHFSEYKAVPKITMSAPDPDSTTTTTTYDNTYTIKGKVNADDTRVWVLRDGKIIGDAPVVGNDREFEKKVALKIGENTVEVHAANGVGESITKIIKIIRLPVITLTKTLKTSRLTTSNSAITVTGTINDPAASASLYVNGKLYKRLSLRKGAFSTSVTLTEGTNKLIVKATTALGAAKNVTRTVTRTSVAGTVHRP